MSTLVRNAANTATEIAALALAGPACANAGQIKPKYGHYYNRPSATEAQAAADIEDCTAIARGTRRPGTVAVGVGAAGLAAGTFASAFFNSLAQGAKVRDNIQNCMVIRGWRLFAMTKADGVIWSKRDEADRRAQLVSLVSADQPSLGSLYREWQNDYAEPRLWPKD